MHTLATMADQLQPGGSMDVVCRVRQFESMTINCKSPLTTLPSNKLAMFLPSRSLITTSLSGL